MSETHHEVELRLVIRDPAALRVALVAAGAYIIGQGLVRTTSFDFPDRRLRGLRQTLRLREDWTGLALTSKLPLSSERDEDAGQAKTRRETTLALPADSGATVREILLTIGLCETLRYDKQRTSWQLGAARVDVDVLADGGACYAEIEAEAVHITATRQLLGLSDAPIETRSYYEIVHLARSEESRSAPGPHLESE